MKINNHKLAAKNINTRFLGEKWGNKAKKWIAACGVIVFMLGGCNSLKKTTSVENSNDQGEKTTVPTEIAPPPIFSSSGDPNFVVKVVQKTGNAVVRIDSTRTVTTQVPDEFSDPFFRGFFGNVIPSQPRSRVERGSGSGFIINSSGQILTNSHVVDGADSVTVTLKDGRTFKGKVLGEDAVTDVAVIQIDANKLPTLALGKSDTLQPGEAVIAIGNPLGLNNTVTSGIISATDRSSSDIGASDKRVDYLQTDAAINPGNSGGPLLNARGEVIGMNTAIIQGAQGLGFAIPINTVQKIAEELITKGRVDHPYLGIQMVTLTPEVKEKITTRFGDKINLAANQGILLVRVVPNSPAAIAGLRPGDVIKSINNQAVLKVDEVQKLVENSKIGIPLQVQVERNGRTFQVLVKPAPLPVSKE
ncbi:HhoA/HhoB/HtrA family serine endopeptidase [Dolichospermum circinale]|uniref:HhoA/HhoB/HtrA family serine endopeptidase n=1 Tax=Dolichospermum circinale TaxID=109265 RepID=UPI000404D678|nr:HhoA/HhoB/HtrA family serine endopeptidase [Dolichospermum circinale]MDB9474149.1 trypsin-like peptidase domain-containing protein [Dolichospermum circinale CS-537/11]MDB9479057.1 trypsin-like peptidase domain-containing protein [Dolichospermum circinale CS-537/03]MDB9483920.1 trypsin-like peptidase domain-containing protein [Dolichospermum circinale CS-537/05]